MKKLIFSLLVLTLPFVAKSQVIDNFSDSEIQNNPKWYGETSKFEIIDPATTGDGSLNSSANDDNFVLRSKPTQGDAVITTLNTYAYGEWRFCVADGSNWSVSSTNDYIIVLMSNDSTVSRLKDGALNFNGYFLRFDGSVSDQFTLYKQSGTTKTPILTTGYPATVDAATAVGRSVKITRSNLGEWKIFIDEGFNVVPTTLRGTTTDNTFANSNYFAISTNISTIGAARVLYFDNLYIGPEIGDTAKPELVNIEVISNKKVKLTFSEVLDSLSVVDTLNYFVNNSIGYPSLATFSTIDRKSVTLEFSSIFADGQSNFLTIDNVADTSGNFVTSLGAYFSYTLIKALSATVVSSSQIDVVFSQTVENVSAQTVSNYFIDNSIGNPLSATIDGTDSKIVHLVLANPLISKNSYNLTIQSVTDLNSNSMLPSNFTFNYFVVSANDVVINEIFPDPTPSIGLPDYEYVELYNTTDFKIPIKDWKITVGTTSKIFLVDTIPAKGYLIVCPTGYESNFTSYGKTVGLLSTTSLTNSGTSIKLENENALLISSVTYSNTWYQDGTAGDNGKSIERIDPLNICQGIENWKASTSSFGGTPGTINSVNAVNVDTISPSILSVSAGGNTIQIIFSENVVNNFSTTDFVLKNSSVNPTSAVISGTNSAVVDLTFASNFVSGLVDTLKIFNISDICGNLLDSAKKSFSYYEAQENDVVINEIFPDPDPSHGLPISEFVELYNTKNIEISLNNWTLSIGGSVKTITNLTIPALGFAIVCPTGNESMFSSYAPANGILSSTALTMTGTNITLSDATGLEINKIDYTVDWFHDAVKDDGGYSIEKIDPTNNCSGITNWKATDNSTGGTPGTINSVNAINVDTISPNIESVYASDAQTLKIVFAEDIIKNLNVSNFVVNNSIGNPSSVVYSVDDSKTITLKFDSSFVSGEIDSLLILNVFDVCGNVSDSIQTSFLFFIANANDVVINEIMPDPDPAIAVPNSEYIELYNSTDVNIPINNWIITVGTTEKTIGNLTIPAKGYAIICPTGNESLFSTYSNANGILSSTALTNSGTSIKLSDVTGKDINSVNYLISWYQDAAKDEGGWSLEKIDPTNNCLGITNWKASVSSDGGTPGAINSINASNIDTIAPIVLSVFAENENTLQVSISEETTQNLTTSNFKANYYGNPSSVEYIDSKTIKLHFDSLFESGKKDTLLILNVVDLCGNITDSTELKFSFYNVQQNDIVVNEIMAAPINHEGEKYQFEYVELYNRSEFDIDLVDWQINIGDGSKTIPSSTIKSKEYLIVCSTFAEASYSQYGEIAAIYSLDALVNSTQSIAIVDNNANTINSVTYYESWYNNASKNDGGWSLELIDPDNFCGDVYNWTASNDSTGGTPGRINSVFAENIDSISPVVENVLVYTNTKLIVRTSEIINKFAAENALNYFVDNAIGNPDSARVDELDRNLINLYFSTEFVTGDTNILYFYNLYDLCDNPLKDTIIEFSFNKVKPYDVVINEFMADPDPVIGLPEKEFIELYNNASYDIDLINWTIKVGSTTKTIPPSKIIPGGFLILCAETDSAIFDSYGNVAEIVSFPSLGNSEGTIVLKNMYSEIISSVDYTSDWYQSTYKDDGGWTLEQIDPNNPCGEQKNWIASKDAKGGTPGAKNSVFASNLDTLKPALIRAVVYDTNAKNSLKLFFDEPMKLENLKSLTNYSVSDTVHPTGIYAIESDFKTLILYFDSAFKQGILYTLSIDDTIFDCVGNILTSHNTSQFAVPDSFEVNDIIINEILVDPLTDGFDFVEIYNRSNKYIDLKDVRIANRDDAGKVDNVKIVSTESRLLFPQSYMVLTENPDVVKEQYYTSNPDAFIKVESMPSYSVDTGDVIIADKYLSEILIDSLAYGESMHYAMLGSTDGVSLERINFDRATQDANNWHSASQKCGFATPGYKNSQYSDSESAEENTVSLSPETFSPDNDGYNDILNINYKFDGVGYTASISIYDMKGRLVKRIANNEVMAIEGVYTWDGISDSKLKANVGLYILLFEAYNMEGKTIKQKLPVVVATKL